MLHDTFYPYCSFYNIIETKLQQSEACFSWYLSHVMSYSESQFDPAGKEQTHLKPRLYRNKNKLTLFWKDLTYPNMSTPMNSPRCLCIISERRGPRRCLPPPQSHTTTLITGCIYDSPSSNTRNLEIWPLKNTKTHSTPQNTDCLCPQSFNNALVLFKSMAE